MKPYIVSDTFPFSFLFWCAIILIATIVFWMGIASASEVNLDIISKIESNNNDLAIGKAGEKGRYQIRPCVLEEYNAWHSASKIASNALFSPVVARKVAEWYMAIRIPQMLRFYHIQDIIDNRIIAWNCGIGNLRNWYCNPFSYPHYYKLPKTTQAYIKKYHKLERNV